MCVCTCVCACKCIYTCMHIQRERESAREKGRGGEEGGKGGKAGGGCGRKREWGGAHEKSDLGAFSAESEVQAKQLLAHKRAPTTDQCLIRRATRRIRHTLAPGTIRRSLESGILQHPRQHLCTPGVPRHYGLRCPRPSPRHPYDPWCRTTLPHVVSGAGVRGAGARAGALLRAPALLGGFLNLLSHLPTLDCDSLESRKQASCLRIGRGDSAEAI
jgi:hypothetical protein